MTPGTKVVYDIARTYTYEGKAAQHRKNTVTAKIVKVEGQWAFLKTGNGSLRKIDISKLRLAE